MGSVGVGGGVWLGNSTSNVRGLVSGGGGGQKTILISGDPGQVIWRGVMHALGSGGGEWSGVFCWMGVLTGFGVVCTFGTRNTSVCICLLVVRSCTCVLNTANQYPTNR